MAVTGATVNVMSPDSHRASATLAAAAGSTLSGGTRMHQTHLYPHLISETTSTLSQHSQQLL